MDSFLNLQGKTVTLITTKKTASAEKAPAACDALQGGKKKKKKMLTEYQAIRTSLRLVTSLEAKHV